jgi:hypothetical protein
MGWKPILLAGVAALICVPTPAPAADLPCRRIQLECAGFEPSWSFVMPGDGTIQFRDPENANFPTPQVLPVCAYPIPGNRIRITTGAPLLLTATVTMQTCNDESGVAKPRKIAISYKPGSVGGGSGLPAQVSGTACCE